MKRQRVTVPIFDYDRTLCSDNVIPSKDIFTGLVRALRDNLGIPLIIVTAGSVNSKGGNREKCKNLPLVYKDGVERPFEVSQYCNLKVLINEFNINADVCIYGKYICDPKDISTDQEINNNNYIRGSVTTHRPLTKIGRDTYHILNAQGEKKLSVMYHILLSHGLDSELLLIDDMYYHDMSGLEGMVLDPFECVNSTYFMIKPLLDSPNKTKFVDDRLKKITASLYEDNFKEIIEKMSYSVWRRF